MYPLNKVKVRYAKASCEDEFPTAMETQKSKTFWSERRDNSDNVMAVFDAKTGQLLGVFPLFN